jgi:DNA polymerase-3 subunit gamma/tau
MRDALSLTDQAIAYSAGNLTEEAVRGMLGTIDQRHLVRLLDALHSGQAAAVLEIADELATRGLSYRAALADLAILLSRVAIVQRVAEAIDDADPLSDDIKRLATALQPDAVQLFYTVSVHSRSELAIAPDEYAGFVMACLRMLSLSGAAGGSQQPSAPVVVQPAAASVSTKLHQTGAPQADASTSKKEVEPTDSAPHDQEPEPEYVLGNDIDYGSEPVLDLVDDDQFSRAPTASVTAPVSETLVLPEPWAGFSAKLPLSGMAAQLARQSEWVAVSGRSITLRVASKALAEGAHADRLRAVLTEYFGFVVQVHFQIGADQGQSAHAVDLAAQAARQRAAEQSVSVDPFVQALMKDFGAQVVPGSIRPGHAAL